MLQKSWNFAILDDRKIAENSLFQRTGICCKMYWILFYFFILIEKIVAHSSNFSSIFPRNFSFRHRWKGGGAVAPPPPPLYTPLLIPITQAQFHDVMTPNKKLYHSPLRHQVTNQGWWRHNSWSNDGSALAPGQYGWACKPTLFVPFHKKNSQAFLLYFIQHSTYYTMQIYYL